MATSSWTVVAPVKLSRGPAQGQWTVADYLSLPEDGQRYEVIEGVIRMAPAPGTGHQDVVGNVFVTLRELIQNSTKGRVFFAPIDVELGPRTVVQPDIVVVLNEHANRITPARIIGAPDLVVEVLSPGTAGYDRREEQDAYAACGVREYWLVDPAAQTIELLVLNQGVYVSHGVFAADAPVPSLIVSGLPPTRDFFPGN